LIGTVKVAGLDVSYKHFIFSGIVAQTILFQGFFEGAYGAFVRMYYQKIFHAMATTPITLSEVLWGELLWGASKATWAAMVVVAIGVAMGAFSAWSLLTLIPVCFVCSLIFSAMGLAAAAFAQSIEELSYPQYLLVFPMFLFCGVFYPLENLPSALQYFAWVFPLTSVISLVRWLTLGFSFEWQTLPILGLWLFGLLKLSRSTMMKRLVK
jgi:lipooligosaccharide transport system permease protein